MRLALERQQIYKNSKEWIDPMIGTKKNIPYCFDLMYLFVKAGKLVLS